MLKKGKCQIHLARIFSPYICWRVHTKMSKTTNKDQLQILLKLMESHRDIACGFHKGAKEELILFWQKAERELNSSGPPIKTIPEWKKVWNDQKKYVRAKAANNLKARNGTGGGPNNEQKFSPYELAVYDLIGMKESIEGVAAKVFGMEARLNKENIQSPIQEVNLPGVEEELEIEYLTQEPAPASTSAKRSPQASKCAKKRTASEAFDQELKIQSELCKAVKDVVDNAKENFLTQKELCVAIKGVLEEEKEMRRNTTKIHRTLEKMYDLKKEKLKETKRHNTRIEELRVREIENKIEHNRRLLDIEELKLREQTDM